MAIGRLLSPKSSPHFNRIGFLSHCDFHLSPFNANSPIPLARRWFSSSLQDGRKFERVPDSEASANKDVGQKGIPWYSLGGLLTNFKQKITGNMLSTGKASGQDSVSVSRDVTATKVVSLQNLSVKEESSVSQDASESVAGTETSERREITSLTEKVDPDMEVELPQIPEALNSSNSSMSSSDRGDQDLVFGKMLSDPVATSADSSIKELQTGNGTDVDANSLNPNRGEGKCVSKGDAVKKKSSSFSAKEEEESKGETLVMQNQTLAVTAANPTVKEHFPNKVMLRFLKENFEKKVIVEAFSKFGAVVDVQEIPSFKGCIYKDALVAFKTKSAVKKALKRAVVTVKNDNVVVEATSEKDMVEQERICIPDLIGDCDVPIGLVKEPTRTVKIHPLEDDISSNQIKEALRLCSSDISKFILSSSKTAAFVEFETEDGKERALAEHSISISSKRLFISRIDIPRTTVARISNLSVLAQRDLWKLCKPYGKIKRLIHRTNGIADVFFEVSEWPKMLIILNCLNGKEIDGMKWVVRPATTVIPPEILNVLWEEPRERRYVKSVIQNLVREIERPLDATRSYTLVKELVLNSYCNSSR